MNIKRIPAVPLITIDPYFSIWSCTDKLYEDETRHWTGACNSMVGMIRYNGKAYRFMGKTVPYGRYYYCEPDILPQTEVNIYPTRTEYKFENEDLILKLTFISPLLMSDLMILSRPVAYITYDIEVKGDKKLDTEIYLDISADCCVHEPTQNVNIFKSDFGMYMGNVEQNVLNKFGDDVRIDYGYLHFAEKDAFCSKAFVARDTFARNKDFATWIDYRPLEENTDYSVIVDNPALSVVRKDKHGSVTIAYDDIKSIEFLGSKLDCYYKANGDTFESMLKKALVEKDIVIEKCIDFDNELMERAKKVSDTYAEIIALTYRQAVAANKLSYDENGLMFINKECGSNGCAATVDITYPSMPIFYLYNSELIKGMLNPIFAFAKTPMWNYKFAPHDVGRYPILNCQYYGYDEELGICTEDMQMPIEECGNMLICTYAVCKKEGNNSYAEEHKELLTNWADYLLNYGFDPGEQLCTDDFGGHLNHNCNLSIKCIIGLYAYGEMFNDENYRVKAKEFAKEWEKQAKDGDHYKMSFDTKDTWSIKYNIVWDKIWDFGLFSDEVFKKETEYYLTKLQKYGIPLDYRSDVGKLDWLMWSAAMTDDREYKDRVVESVANMISETKQRVPLTDYYHVDTAEQHIWTFYGSPTGFTNRSVVGGLAILMI